MTCLVMEECDVKFMDCGGSGIKGTINYIKYAPVLCVAKGFCRYPNDIDEAFDMNEEACESGYIFMEVKGEENVMIIVLVVSVIMLT